MNGNKEEKQGKKVLGRQGKDGKWKKKTRIERYRRGEIKGKMIERDEKKKI